MKLQNLVVLSAMPLLLSGCLTTLAMQGLNGTAPCPPAAMRTAMANSSILAQAQPGDNIASLSGMAAPERVKQVALPDGRALNILGFRTGHPRCRGLSETELTPVVVAPGGTILGIGPLAYRQYVRR